MVVSSATTTFLVNQFSCCPSCGFDIGPLENDPSTRLLESQARIVELETQVCLLNQRANAAIGRWAEYEAELAKLRAQIRPSSSTSTATSSASSASASSAGAPAAGRASLFQSGASRLSALVYSRSRQVSGGSAAAAAAGGPTKSSSGVDGDLGGRTEAVPPPAPAPAAPVTAKATATATATQENLREALEREQSLRRAAEKRLSATSKEVEELSAALFEQANEMVADERRARARLEQRVGELEKRDVDKKRRLDRLETAMGRIERARLLLSQGPQSDPLLPGHSEP